MPSKQQTQDSTALLWSARQCADACGTSLATWWRWESAGRCPRGIKSATGGTTRWSGSTIRSWLQASEQAGRFLSRTEFAARSK